jgi:hypothetical protein
MPDDRLQCLYQEFGGLKCSCAFFSVRFLAVFLQWNFNLNLSERSLSKMQPIPVNVAPTQSINMS